MSAYDLVIRGGKVVDGTGAAPFEGDIAVKGGRIVAIGAVSGAGAEEIDAKGCVVTPGFVDVHTHYDGQVTWEETMAPSSGHGVTTVLMGNCGVGFAPVRPGDHQLMIKLMEGVEDIPEVVMAEGVPFNWETFPDYLDALDKRRSDVDFATQLPHSPLRVYVMGERGANLEPPTEDDLKEMRRLTTEAIKAGALGVTTSRSLFHRFRSGKTAPSVKTEVDELLALAGGLRDAGAGVFQMIPNTEANPPQEIAVLRAVAKAAGRPLNFSLVTSGPDWRKYITELDVANDEGLALCAQFMPRPIGVLFGLELSFHPFSLNPSYKALAHLPLAERVARMRDPEVRGKILSEQPDDPNPAFVNLVTSKRILYPLQEPARYDFDPDDSLAVRAERLGRPYAEVIYDALLEDEGRAILCSYSTTVPDYIEKVVPLIGHDHAVVALGDGGAHYGMICDAAYPTYMLKDRCADGLDIETAIKALTSQPATSVGLNDRGVIGVGYKADLNVIDVSRLELHRPIVKHDLPAGGKRLSQKADGYVATVLSGVITYRDGKPTGRRPGRLVRGARGVARDGA